MILSDNHPIGPLRRADLIGETAAHCFLIGIHVLSGMLGLPEGRLRLTAYNQAKHTMPKTYKQSFAAERACVMVFQSLFG